jgi:hypothetical protein
MSIADCRMGLFKKFTNKFTAPNASVQLKFGSNCVALGENLTGTLTVFPKEDFDATEVRCEMQCTEQAQVIKDVYDSQLRRTIPRTVDETSVLFSARPPLAGPTKLITNGSVDFPFSINLPAGGRPTYHAVDRSVTWTIKGVVAVDGRPDVTSHTCEVQVVAPAAQPVIREKEVLREVVMIPCKYCNGLMEQTLTVCPNCGAKRTA